MKKYSVIFISYPDMLEEAACLNEQNVIDMFVPPEFQYRYVQEIADMTAMLRAMEHSDHIIYWGKVIICKMVDS